MTDITRLDGEVAIVTGAAEGIGRGIANVLAEAGATFADVVKLTTYVVRKEDTQKARDLVGRHFSEHPPANTLCVLQGLATPAYLVEIEAIAVLA